MKAVRQIRSSELKMILPATDISAGSAVQHGGPAEDDDLFGDEGAQQAFNSDVQTKNIELLSEVVEYEQFLETTNEVQLEGVRTQRETLATRSAGSAEALRRYDNFFRYPTSSFFNKEKLVERLDMEVSTSALIKNLQSARKIGKLKMETISYDAQPEDGADTLNLSISPRDRGDCDASSGVSTARSGVSNIALPPEVATSASRIEELLTVLHRNMKSSDTQASLREELSKMCSAYFGNAGHQLSSSLVQLNALAFTDVMQYIKMKVNGTNGAFAEKLDAVAAAKEMCKSLDEVDVTSYDTARGRYLSAIDDALKLNSERLNQLMLNKESSGNFRSTYDTCNTALEAILKEQRDARTFLVSEIQRDRVKLAEEGERQSFRDESLRTMYEWWNQESHQRIGVCTAQQDVLWAEVEVLLRKIGDIGRERGRLVKRHLELVEEEYQRRRYHDELMHVHQTHTANMEAIEELSRVALKLLDSMDGYHEHLTTAVDAKNFEEGLTDMKLSDQRAFMNLFIPLVTTITDLLARRNGSLIIQKKSLRLQEELSNDRTNPTRAANQERKAELIGTVSALERSCDEMIRLFEKWEPLYGVVLEQLLASGVEPPEDPFPALDVVFGNIVSDAFVAATSNVESDVAAIDRNLQGVQQEQGVVAAAESSLAARRQTSPERRKVTRRKVASRPSSSSSSNSTWRVAK
jgi:hypothetical protein